MLDRAAVQQFLEEQFEDDGIRVPKYIELEELTEAFCQYVENDYYEWLKDNYKSFFAPPRPNWAWIKGEIKSK